MDFGLTNEQIATMNYKKGRSDGIDACIKKLKKHKKELRNDYVKQIINDALYCNRDDEIEWIIEMLQEIRKAG